MSAATEAKALRASIRRCLTMCLDARALFPVGTASRRAVDESILKLRETEALLVEAHNEAPREVLS